MPLRIVTSSLMLAALGCVASLDFARGQQSGKSQALTLEKFREIHAELRPDEQAPWRTIPWKIGLLDAQNVAAQEGKPIFIWAMDGHPLGCT